MGIFDGIDEERQKQIREKLVGEVRRDIAREVRREVADELRASIRKQVEADIRSETRRQLLREIEERRPTETERENFSAYVKDVELDAYAQATMAADVAEQGDEALAESRRWGNRALALLIGTAPLIVVLREALGQMGHSSSFTAAAIALLATLLAYVLWSWRHRLGLEQRIAAHRKISSDFLIIAERAKAYRMVHAERLVEAEELHELLEGLRIAKERQDAIFHSDPEAIESTRESVRHRVEPKDEALRIVDKESDEESSEGCDKEEAAARARRR